MRTPLPPSQVPCLFEWIRRYKSVVQRGGLYLHGVLLSEEGEPIEDLHE